MTQMVMILETLKAMTPEEIQVLVATLLEETLLAAVPQLVVMAMMTMILLMAVTMILTLTLILNQMDSSCKEMFLIIQIFLSC